MIFVYKLLTRNQNIDYIYNHMLPLLSAKYRYMYIFISFLLYSKCRQRRRN